MKIYYILLLIIGFIFLQPPNRVLLENSFCEINFNHFLGCDRLGREISSLYIYGSLSTLIIAIPSKILAIISSLILSFFAITGGKIINIIINSISSIFLSIPSLLIALVIVYTLGKSIDIFILSLVITDWASSYETIYSKLNEIYKSGYVYISKNYGANSIYIFRKHIIRELFPLLKIIFITGIPSMIMTITIYSYLGINFGSEYFGPGLGEQIAFSKDYFDKSPFSVLMPILGIFLLVNLFRVYKDKIS